MNQPTPLVCQVGALSAEENRLRRSLFAALRKAVVSETSSDREVTWALSRTEEALSAAGRLVALEARCCPFLGFELRVEPAEGPLTLRVRGPAGTGEFLAREVGP